MGLTAPITCSPTISCEQAIEIMVTNGNLLAKMTSSRVSSSDPISEFLYKKFASVQPMTSLYRLSKIFDKNHYAVVVATQKCFISPEEVIENTVVVGVASRIDLA